VVARVGVLFVHGMGNLGPDYADALRERIVAALDGTASAIAFEAVHYRDPIEVAQANLWDRWRPHTGGLDDPELAFVRYGLVVSGFGDVLAYVQTHRASIHDRVRDGLARLRVRLERPARAPLVIVAHSLGSVVAEDYVRRNQDGDALGDSPFARAETLTALYTLGSPLPLFRLTTDLPPVRVPGPAVPERMRTAAEWVNFHSRSDVFGMPLGILNAAYAEAVVDVRSSNRGLVGGHLGYWKNATIARRIALGLQRILTAHEKR
jgi:hypothetical protein